MSWLPLWMRQKTCWSPRLWAMTCAMAWRRWQHLGEMQSAMRRGRDLLQRKEEKLSELEAPLQDEDLDEDPLRGPPSKKVVTFDLSDTEDTNTGSSASWPLPHGSRASPAFPHKIQYLDSSLRHLSSQLHQVLSLLGTQQPLLLTSTPAARRPLPPEDPTPRLSSSATQALDDFLVEKWRKYFPAGSPSPAAACALGEQAGLVSVREQLRLLQPPHSQVPEVGSAGLQGMMEAERWWLEHYRNDPTLHLFSVPKPAASGLLPLSLDENNRLQVNRC